MTRTDAATPNAGEVRTSAHGTEYHNGGEMEKGSLAERVRALMRAIHGGYVTDDSLEAIAAELERIAGEMREMNPAHYPTTTLIWAAALAEPKENP